MPKKGYKQTEEHKEKQRNKIVSKETRRKLSEINKGKKGYWTGKHISEETKKKISESKKGDKHPNYGKHHSKETIERMKAGMKLHLKPSCARFDNGVCYIEIYDIKGNMVAETIIDVEDYDKVKEYRLHPSKSDKNKIYTRIKTNTGVYLHHIIMGKPDKGLVTDHINRYTLDNRKCNLRFVNASNNGMNKGKAPDKTSRYKGVHWDNYRNRWKAEIKLNGKCKYIGRFFDENEAGLAYNKKAKELFGEYAHLNTIIYKEDKYEQQ